jgi:hypothetical protein
MIQDGPAEGWSRALLLALSALGLVLVSLLVAVS